MNHIAVILILLVGGSSLALAQSAGGSSSGGSAASGTAATGSTGYAGGTLSTGHTISGTAGSSDPNVGNALSHAGAGGDVDASSVTQAPTSHDNAVDTPAAERAMKNLGNTDIGILKK
ncbi:hypothetical protein QA641_40305 [Bradyrhizobium sp. CB1650]|uniref:hypothetical protein n=1 Tax=Bradyrhizobium sp. CB1650 TaxID=3039153 RepID=UPI002435FD57|nr:hypothetical protein [Bradyrhizobium sp. CB1650]WGD51604.1 hypothetical protein QA641_40305 [Bradyrhizobium sp. CB1650]